MNKEQFHREYGIYPLRQWSYPKTRPYNGFTPDERIRGWQLTMWFVDNGWLDTPTICSITGETSRVGYHNENYFTPWEPHAISQTPHSALHQRFTKPVWWRRIVEANAKTGKEWFCHIPSDANDDLAANHRSRFGDDASDVFAHAPVPNDLEIPWALIRPAIHPL